MDPTNAFSKALQFVLKWEGGYEYDPNDPGGETNFGISKHAYPDLDIRNLTPAQAMGIYKADYWNKIDGDNQPYPQVLAYFDTAVNDGVSRSLGWIQQAGDDVKAFLALRRQFYIDLVNKKPTDVKYIRGWLNRVADLTKLIDIESQQDSGS